MILDDLIANMGVSLETYVLLVIVLGSLIFMAKEMRLGLVISFVLTATALIIFYSFNRNTTLYVTVLLLEFGVLTISLLISNNKRSVI